MRNGPIENCARRLEVRLVRRRWMAAFALLAFPCFLGAQHTDDSKPAVTNVRAAEYPRVHADGRVTFRVKAPTAQKVQVQPGPAAGEPSGLGAGRFDMVRDKDGVWTVTTPPAVPGFHYYWLLVDGVEVNDPSSETFFGYNKETSAVEVPEPGVEFYLPKAVPHGEIHEHWYHSGITGEWRRAAVYTPPGYDANPRTRYPVLYLQHGGGENVTGWPRQGRMNFILDNLIAERKAQPMIVVMETGYAFRPGEKPPAAGAPQVAHSTLEDVIVTELIPNIDASYRTLADRDHRAMAGLSMGSRQTLQITLTNLDKFSYIGAFSRPPAADFDATSAYNGVFHDAAAFNKKVHLLWMGAGTTEHQIHDSAKASHEALDKAHIKNVFIEFPGTAHEWQTWRKALYDFAPRLFR
ncbi:MAG: esterase [Terriglobia bacterium]|nr:MAG: esterase [Terriglobia bacterium]